MRQYLYLFLSSILAFLIFLIPIHAADFNIKLRKTDINELKQQLMPAFEQNILYLNELLSCLERKKRLIFVSMNIRLSLEAKNPPILH